MSLLSELERRNVIRVAVAYSVTAWLVAQVAELAFDSFGAPDWVMKTLLFVLAVGLVFAIVFAWAYEITPEGVKREKDVDRSQSITNETGRKLNYTIIGILAAALVFSVVTHRWTTGEIAPALEETVDAAANVEKSIAVLPFVNMSDDPNNVYFSDGLSEELLNVLVKVEGLRVASRTSTFSFKGTDTPIPEIAEALNVAHVLEGSVRKSGDTVRVTAQLIDVKTDSHLWSETYDRKLEDIFVIQDEISAHIVDALKVALGASEVIATSGRPTNNLEAYESYLRGRHFWQLRGADNIRKSIELFTLATQADPGFARAWSSLAAAHITFPAYAQEPFMDHYPLAQQYASRALELDPTIADAHSVLGDLNRGLARWMEAEEHYLKAIELEPKNPTGHLWYAEHLASTGRGEAAHHYAMTSLELDPFNAGVNSVASLTSNFVGDLEQAKRLTIDAWELGHPRSIFNWITNEMLDGNYDRAYEIIDANASAFPPGVAAAIRLRVDAFRDPAHIDEYLTVLNGPLGPDEISKAIEYARLDRVQEAAEILREADVVGNAWAVLWLPENAALREHEVFADLLVDYKLTEFWDEIGWPEQCSRRGEAITCR